MQFGAAKGIEPLAIADQTIKNSLARQMGRAAIQQVKQDVAPLLGRGPIVQGVEDPAKGRFAIRIANRAVGIPRRDGAFDVAIVGKRPILAVPLALERMAIVQGHHPLGGLADMGQGIEGLEIVLGHLGRQGGERRCALFSNHPQAAALGIKARQPPAIGMLPRGPAAAGEAAEGKTHIGRGIGTQGQQFTHEPRGVMKQLFGGKPQQGPIPKLVGGD